MLSVTCRLPVITGTNYNRVRTDNGVQCMADQLSLEGHFLIAMPGMGDPRFEKTLIFICAHSKDGAMGFIVNRSIDQPSTKDFFSQLEIVTEDELKSIPEETLPKTLQTGGPVEPGRGFVLHSRDYRSDASMVVHDGVCLTATLEILRAIATGKGPEKKIIALGYSGWASGQLEEEISANGWLTCPASPEIIFDKNLGDKYERSLALMGIDHRLLSQDAGHA